MDLHPYDTIRHDTTHHDKSCSTPMTIMIVNLKALLIIMKNLGNKGH
jgi:hypothetical protein